MHSGNKRQVCPALNYQFFPVIFEDTLETTVMKSTMRWSSNNQSLSHTLKGGGVKGIPRITNRSPRWFEKSHHGHRIRTITDSRFLDRRMILPSMTTTELF